MGLFADFSGIKGFRTRFLDILVDMPQLFM